jgi:hypothetical protein
MTGLSSLRKKIRKLELCQESIDRSPEFNAFEEITLLALRHPSAEEMDLLLALHSGKQTSELNPTGEPSPAQKAAIGSFNNAVQKECERLGITVEQYNERRGLAKPLVMSLKRQQMARNRSRSRFRKRPNTEIVNLF